MDTRHATPAALPASSNRPSPLRQALARRAESDARLLAGLAGAESQLANLPLPHRLVAEMALLELREAFDARAELDAALIAAVELIERRTWQ